MVDSQGKLKRDIGLLTATCIVIGNMIGSGVFVTSGIIAGKLPNATWVMSFWLAGGVIAIMGSLCYSELATRMPEEGGEYVYLSKLLHPLFGFLAGWTSLIVGFSAPIAGSALGFSEYFFSGINVGDISHLVIIKKCVAISIVLVFTLIHFLGVKKGGYVQNALVLFKVATILGIITLGFALGKPDWKAFLNETTSSSGEIAMGTALLLIMFSYSGWNASGYIAGEIKNPKRNIPFSLIMGTSVVMLLYLGLNMLFLSSGGTVNDENSITVFERTASVFFGQYAGQVVSIIISVFLLSSLSAFIMIGPRVYYAMARDKLFFRFAARLNPRYNVPGRSIVIQGLLAIFFVAFSSVEQLLIFLYYALNLFPCLVVIALFVARKKKVGELNAVKVPGYPVTPFLFLVASVYIAVMAFINSPKESVSAIAMILIGVPCYYLVIKGFRPFRKSRQEEITAKDSVETEPYKKLNIIMRNGIKTKLSNVVAALAIIFISVNTSCQRISYQKIVIPDFPAEGLILDIGGGGEGVIGQLKGDQAISIDISKAELTDAPSRNLKIVMDARDLKFIDNSFNTVVIFYTMMYINCNDHEKVLSEAYRVLKPGGKLMIWDVDLPATKGKKSKLQIFSFKFLLPEKNITTGYGTHTGDKEQDLQYYIDLAVKTGFEEINTSQTNSSFFMEMKKPE